MVFSLRRKPSWLFRAGMLLLPVVFTGCSGGSKATVNPPTVSLQSSLTQVVLGQSATLTWTSANASSCSASGAWSGTEPVSGSQSVTPATTGSFTYTLNCTGAGGSSSSSATLTVSAPQGLSISNTFTPNAATLSTSEGAPYSDCDFWTANPSPCAPESKYGYGPTKVMHMDICLSGEVPLSSCSQQPAVTGPLSTAMVNSINTGIAAYAGSGMRLLVRFVYNYGPIGSGAMDAPISVISQHIDQLAPILLQNKDLIFAFEAGFIGTWGEWHDSTNGNDTAAAHKAVLDKELSYFSGVFPILVRYPRDLMVYTGTNTPPAGLGLHDDYYASSSDDGGTWYPCDASGNCLPGVTASQLQAYGAAISTNTMFGGEFGDVYSKLQTCSALDNYSGTYHAQSIGLDLYPTTIATEIQNEGCLLSFFNKVGTRIELQKVTITGNPAANGQLQLGITLANTGYGRVIRPRPVTLLFVSGTTVAAQFSIPLTTLDLRQLTASSPQTFPVTVTLPSTFPTTGSISAVLLIPDPASSLTTQPAYALPLNSLDSKNNSVFDPKTGYNLLATFNAQ